ncbi:hypothetical protein PZBJ_02815 [Pantoea endophytica]|jgi:hypothetical protein|uniref:Uncharacterized protein n=1 Tax=Pantoea endophytica TaxID=92488 RepID=A0ABX4STQ9_9GAMM|nr:hypothetical protein PZBJ_02815 [Pantoea endophytica]
MRLEAVQPHRLAKGEVEEQSSRKENLTVHHHGNPFIRMQLDKVSAAHRSLQPREIRYERTADIISYLKLYIPLILF